MWLLWQALPVLPDATWWSQWGPLGVVAGILTAAAVTYIWLIDFPHRRAKQKLELEHAAKIQQQELEHKTETERLERETAAARFQIELERERKGLALFETVRVLQVADQQHKEKLTETSVKMTALTERVVALQEHHAKVCNNTHELVLAMTTRPQHFAPVPLKCQGDHCDNTLNGRHHFINNAYLCDDCFRELEPAHGA